MGEAGGCWECDVKLDHLGTDYDADVRDRQGHCQAELSIRHYGCGQLEIAERKLGVRKTVSTERRLVVLPNKKRDRITQRRKVGKSCGVGNVYNPVISFRQELGIRG